MTLDNPLQHTPAQVLLELAERCERAEGPDRELDEAILRSAWTLKKGQRGDLGPRFTTSIDAALTLVPEGWQWLLRAPSKHGPNDNGRHFARIESPDFESVTWGKGEDWITDVTGGQEVYTWAATPALALCAAALKALASMDRPPLTPRGAGD